jgi:hypothetical protein
LVEQAAPPSPAVLRFQRRTLEAEAVEEAAALSWTLAAEAVEEAAALSWTLEAEAVEEAAALSVEEATVLEKPRTAAVAIRPWPCAVFPRYAR